MVREEIGAAGNVLEVTPETVNATAGQIGEAVSEFGQRLRLVDDEIRHLLGKGWQATPASQFHDAFVEWHQGASDVIGGMTQLVAALQDAARNFHLTDQPR